MESGKSLIVPGFGFYCYLSELSTCLMPEKVHFKIFVLAGPPTPLNGYHKVIFTRLSGLRVMTVSVLGYPEPIEYIWYKKMSGRWRRLSPLSNLLFGMDGFHANLTINNVTNADYGDYAVKANSGLADDNVFTQTYTLYKQGNCLISFQRTNFITNMFF